MLKKWTKEAVFEESRKYRTKADFRKGSPAAYSAAQKHGWLKEMIWFEKPVSWKLKWTKNAVFEESKKYTTLDLFRYGSPGAYGAAYNKGWLDEMPWLERKKIKRGFWKIKKNVFEEARKYSSRKEFLEKCVGAYDSARINGWLDEMPWLEKNKQMPPNHWNVKRNVFEESHKYTSRVDFRLKSSGAYNSARKNGWLNEMTWLVRMRKDSGYWDIKANVFAEAKKYKYKSDFHRLSSAAYISALKHGWLQEMDWIQQKNIDKAPSGPIHLVYVYVDEVNKAAYVGATNDIQRRDDEHRKKIEDPLFQYFKNLGREIPNYTILVEGLTIKERQREERVYSLYYRDILNYSLINKIELTGENIGSIGSLVWKWTKSEVIKEAKKYKTPTEFFTKAAGAYDAALRYKMNNEETFPWLYIHKRPQGWWNVKEHVINESKKYKTWDEFFWKSPAAYNAVKKKHKCEDEMTWLERAQVPAYYWQNEDHVIEESKKYKTRTEFHKGSHAAYDYAYKNNLWNKMPWIKMKMKEKGFWTKDRVFEEGKKFTTKVQFKKESYTAYTKAVKYHWIDEMTWFVSEIRPRGYWQEKTNVIAEGKKYQSRVDFRWGNPSAYRSAMDNGWIEEMTWLVRPANYNLKWTREVVFEEAKKYTSRGGFKKGASTAYQVARENGWLDLMNWLSSIRKRKGDKDKKE